MKTEKTTYSLRQDTIVFTVDCPVLESIDEAILCLSAEQKLAVWDLALSQWSYRKAAKKDNHGKHFTFLEVVNDMIAVRSSEGKPSKEDIAHGKEAWAKMEKELVPFKNQLIRREDVEDTESDIYISMLAEEIENRISAIASKLAGVFGPLGWSYDQEADPALNLARLQRAARLAKERKAKKDNLLD